MIWTDEQVEWVTAFILNATGYMELHDWRIVLQDGYPASADAAAQINCVYGRKYAQLWLCKDFFDNDFDTVSHYLVHELCHLYADTLDKLVDTLRPALGEAGYNAFVGGFTMQMEVMVDTIAYAIGDLLDLDELRADYDELTA